MYGEKAVRSEGEEYARGVSGEARSAFPILAVVYLTLFVCALFTAVASFAVLASLAHAGHQEAGLFGRLLAKGTVFSVVSVFLGWMLRAKMKAFVVPDAERESHRDGSKKTQGVLLVAAVLGALLLLPNLGLFPWTAPDEVHHLIVAKNLAEHRAYASGHPADGLRYFDYYTSVGAPVIVPVAAAFALTGPNLTSARLIIVAAFVLLCAAVFSLFRTAFTPFVAALAVLMTLLAADSVYLSRSLYGEVPALMFFVSGLCFWGRSIQAERPVRAALAAGLFFGLAVLTKTFMLISVMAFVGLFLYDRLTFKRIRLPHVLWPALSVAGVLLAWSGVQLAYREQITESLSPMIYYRHYLMIGFGSMADGFNWLLTQPVTLVVGVAGLCLAVPQIFYRRYNPAVAVLFLTALLFAFWWVAFTPANIPRYTWYTGAIAAMFSGVLLEKAWRGARAGRDRVAWIAIVALVLGTGLSRVQDKAYRIYTEPEQESELMLAEFVRALPDEARIATTYWPVKRSVNFFAGRLVAVEKGLDEAVGRYDYVILDSESETIAPEILKASERAGRYVIVKGDG